MFDESSDPQEDAEKDWWNEPASATIFLVDATNDMHENDRLQSCFKTFQSIVRQKCVANKKDKLGLVIFGTKETNCEIDNVMVLQNFEAVSVDTLKNIQTILKDDSMNKYKAMACNKYPLDKALSYAFQTLHASKTNSKLDSTIVLCTSRANPSFDSPLERHRIEHLVASFKDMQTKLLVIGLSDPWKDEIFFKDLQIISGSFNDDSYKQIQLKDLEDTIAHKARNICKLPFKITPNIKIPVSMYNLVSKTRYPSKIKIQKDNNQILQTRRIFRHENTDDLSLNTIMPMERTEDDPPPEKKIIVNRENLNYYRTFGGSKIYFKDYERKEIRNVRSDSSIEILAFKPIACDPAYHCKPPYFVTCTALCTQENKACFKAFVSKCSSKEVMIICKLSSPYAFCIAMMIPSKDDGGFYFYKMPFNSKVRNLNDKLQSFIFNSERPCPTNVQAVHYYKKLMDSSLQKFNPKTFKNQKIERYIVHIEALALDEKLGPMPPDSTVPPPISDHIQDLANGLRTLLNLPNKESRKRKKTQKGPAEKRSKSNTDEAIRRKTLDTFTVVELKDILKEIKLSTIGRKDELIKRIYNYYK